MMFYSLACTYVYWFTTNLEELHHAADVSRWNYPKISGIFWIVK